MHVCENHNGFVYRTSRKADLDLGGSHYGLVRSASSCRNGFSGYDVSSAECGGPWESAYAFRASNVHA